MEFEPILKITFSSKCNYIATLLLNSFGIGNETQFPNLWHQYFVSLNNLNTVSSSWNFVLQRRSLVDIFLEYVVQI